MEQETSNDLGERRMKSLRLDELAMKQKPEALSQVDTLDNSSNYSSCVSRALPRLSVHKAFTVQSQQHSIVRVGSLLLSGIGLCNHGKHFECLNITEEQRPNLKERVQLPSASNPRFQVGCCVM